MNQILIIKAQVFDVMKHMHGEHDEVSEPNSIRVCVSVVK
jgi:hypothetical protein